MLYVTFRNQGGGSNLQTALRVGISNTMAKAAADVIEIQADGDELARIVYEFTTNSGQITIPYSTSRVQSWYGDIARTIASAWPSYNESKPPRPDYTSELRNLHD